MVLPEHGIAAQLVPSEDREHTKWSRGRAKLCRVALHHPTSPTL